MELTYRTHLWRTAIDVYVGLRITQVSGTYIVHVHRYTQRFKHPGQEVGPLGDDKTARYNQAIRVIAVRMMAVDKVPYLVVCVVWLGSFFLSFMRDKFVNCCTPTYSEGDLATFVTLPAKRTAVTAGLRVSAYLALALDYTLFKMRLE
jgi:hypothetical protein